jgi:threonine/homoserine/homoserine lactone efflux protein
MHAFVSSPWVALAGAVAIASITPGPNNVLVMRAAATHGIAGAVPSIVGIVLGGLGLLTLSLIGVLPLFAATPWARPLLVTAGCAYLGWLGWCLATSRPAAMSEGTNSSVTTGICRSAGLWASAGFQFLNPKSWVLVLTVCAAAANAGAQHVLLGLGLLLVLIPTMSLALWSILGVALARLLSQERRRRRFDRFMGLLLIICALTLLRSL